MGNNIATPHPLPFCWVDAGNRNKTLIMVAISPRVAASLGEPMLLRGPEEGSPSGRTIGQMVRWHHPGEIRTYFQGWP